MGSEKKEGKKKRVEPRKMTFDEFDDSDEENRTFPAISAFTSEIVGNAVRTLRSEMPRVHGSYYKEVDVSSNSLLQEHSLQTTSASLSQITPSIANLTARSGQYKLHRPPIQGPNSTGKGLDYNELSTLQLDSKMAFSNKGHPFGSGALLRPSKFEQYFNRETYKPIPPLSNMPHYTKIPYPLPWGVPIRPTESRKVLAGYVCPEAFRFQRGQPMSMTSYFTRRHYNKLCAEWIPVKMRNRK